MAGAEAPSIQEMCERTRSALHAAQDADVIAGCGRAALALLPRDPETCMQLAHQQLNSVPFKDVKTCWRRLYTDAALYQVVEMAEEWSTGKRQKMEEQKGVERRSEEEEGEGEWITKISKMLDMALILTGAPEREELVERWFAALRGVVEKPPQDEERPTKKRKIDTTPSAQFLETFPANISPSPILRNPIPRKANLSLAAFQSKMSDPASQTPMIIEGAIDHWPALDGERAWKRPSYLLQRTLGGRRLVPVEIGRSYTDDTWGQKILTFGEFMKVYMLTEDLPPPSPLPSSDSPNGIQPAGLPSPTIPKAPPASQKGYLAQHDLFAQIPSLRSDISIPDYCYTEPAAQPTNPSHVLPVARLDDPLLHAWFGPGGTISPLHTDPYHNIFAQVVGHKYVRLYAPHETGRMYPRGVDESGIDMSNTSAVDLDEAMATWAEISCWEEGGRDALGDAGAGDYDEGFPGFRRARYVEGVLGPGECLYIPVGWWHYVRSLTPSFSVSFWWN